MTKGKYGQRAALHQAVTTRDSEIEVYKRNIVQLNTDLKAERAARFSSDEAHRKLVRELQARIDLAAAPKVDALELVLKRRTEERDHAARKQQEYRVLWEKVISRLMDHFKQDHGIKDGKDAFGAAARLVSPEFGDSIIVDNMKIMNSLNPGSEFLDAIVSKRNSRYRGPQ